MDIMSSMNTVLLRRNGKPQSCEPCRTSKVRCDHKTPVCDRCIARRLTKDCIYHPAPLTRPPKNSLSPSIRTPIASRSARVRSARSTRASKEYLLLQSVPQEPVPNGIQQSSSPAVWSRSAARATPSAETGFLGSTSFLAVIEDDRDIVDQRTESLPGQEPVHVVDNAANKISEERIMAGMNVLKLLADLPSLEDSIERYIDLCHTCMVPIPQLRICVATIQETFHGSCLRTSKREYLRKQVISLFENTSKPLELFTPVQAKDYHISFTGPNLRWEIVGFVLAMFGASLKYDVNRKIDQSSGSLSKTGPELIFRLVEAVEYCIAVCRACNSVNHQALWLLYADGCLQDLVFGDISFQVWRSIGDVTSMFFALGLHNANAKQEEHLPYYQCEMRRRYAAQIFSIDKSVSTILGRPPRISGRYCANVLPLDIDDSVLFLESEELIKSLHNVDAGGWNIDRKFRGSTWRRMKLIVSQFREEVLEVYLGTSQDDIKTQAQNILIRHEIVWDQIPSALKYDEFTRSEHVPPPERYIMMTTHMDQNYNRFLLHRMLVKHTQCSRENLYSISRSLLATVLQVISLSDQFYRLHRDISWFVLYYGLPSASILAVDLLKQSIEAHTADKELDTIPRSEVIRNLAVFLSALQRTVDRREVNGDACRWAHRFLSRVLNDIIDPKHRETTIEEAQGQPEANFSLATNFGPDGDSLNVDEFLNWVEEIDWDPGISGIMI